MLRGYDTDCFETLFSIIELGINVLLQITFSALLLAISPVVYAGEDTVPWTVYLVFGVTISLVGAIVLSKRNKAAESIGLKVMLGGLYFWGIAFIQLILLAVIYFFNQ